MVDVQSQEEGRPETRLGPQPNPSAFKQYLEQHPDMANELTRVML